MAKKKPSALEALVKLNDERLALEARAADLKRAAAIELGMVVFDAGGADLGPPLLRELIAKAVTIGSDAMMRLLSGGRENPAATTKARQSDSASQEAANG